MFRTPGDEPFDDRCKQRSLAEQHRDHPFKHSSFDESNLCSQVDGVSFGSDVGEVDFLNGCGNAFRMLLRETASSQFFDEPVSIENQCGHEASLPQPDKLFTPICDKFETT